MAYADYAFYTEKFFGDELTEQTAPKWLERASDFLDTITFGRLTFAFPTVEAHVLKVKKAVCALAEALCAIDLQRKATAPQASADGSFRGAVASVTSGKESITYASGESSSVYGKAAADASERDRLLRGIAANYLANIPDAHGINLLYAGGVKHVPGFTPGNDNPVQPPPEDG